VINQVLVRCDYFNGSGYGHLQRCLELALSFNCNPSNTLLFLDEVDSKVNSGHASFKAVGSNSWKDEISDARLVKSFISLPTTCLVILDSYRMGNRWISCIQESGAYVLVINDTDRKLSGNFVVDYRPQESRAFQIEHTLMLKGTKYFLTRYKKRRGAGVRRDVILHAGGAGLFRRAPNIYKAASLLASQLCLKIDWLVPDEKTLAYLNAEKIIRSEHNVVEWRNSDRSPWEEYRYVIGPASTSVYESIMADSIPISFPLSESQKTSLNDWIRIGHCLHIDKDHMCDISYVRKIIKFAFMHESSLRQEQLKTSDLLDGCGSLRVKKAVERFIIGYRSINSSARTRDGLHECTVANSIEYLNARNSPDVRKLSGSSKVIAWEEHLEWWMRPDIKKFVFIMDSAPVAYIWHRLLAIDKQLYITAGWFPATSQTSFLEMSKAVVAHISDIHKNNPEAIWLASVHPDNIAAKQLNHRCGFNIIEPHMTGIAKQILPTTPDGYILMIKMPTNASVDIWP